MVVAAGDFEAVVSGWVVLAVTDAGVDVKVQAGKIKQRGIICADVHHVEPAG